MDQPAPEPTPAGPPRAAGGPSGDRLPGLDVLRGLLVLAVAIYHLSVWNGLYPAGSWPNMAISKLGNYGVQAFLMLSGFVLFRTDWEDLRRGGLGRFYLRRFARLAPVFYLAVGLNLALGLGMGPQPSLRMVAENLTFTFGLFHPNHALVTGGWYVGLVALLYGAYPALAWLRARGGVLVLLGAALLLGLWSLPPTLHGVMGADPAERFHLYVLPRNQAFVFLLGGLLAWLHGRFPLRLSPRALVPAALLLALLIAWRTPPFQDHLEPITGWIRYRYLILTAGLVLLFALQGTTPGAVGRAVARLGTWSYGIYLLHPVLHRILGGRLQGWSAFALVLGGSILLGALAERWLERPVARWAARRKA